MAERGYISATTSTCATCGRLLPTRIHAETDGVWFHKHCPEHGPQRVRVYADADAYLGLGRFHRAGSVPLRFETTSDRGCPDSCGLCPEHEQHVCMPIIEITDHCDLTCPICLVDNQSRKHVSRRDVAGMLDRLIASEGQIDVVNLSGGEPTLNPSFREIVEECLSRPEILRVSISTNGLILLHKPGLLEFLAERNVVISLQFDGRDDEACKRLRGRSLVSQKMELIDRATALDAPMSLTCTVAGGANDHRLADPVELLFERPNILSVMFQPAAYPQRTGQPTRPDHATTIPDVVRGLDGAAGGRVSWADFSPLPCSHPACFSLAFYLKIEGGFVPVKRLVEIDRYLDIIQNRAIFGTDAASFESIKAAVYDLWSGPAALVPDSEKALRAIKHLIGKVTGSCSCGFSPARAVATAERSVKSIFIHHFMDRHTFDLSRARKCCNVYPLPDGGMVPACVYNCLRR